MGVEIALLADTAVALEELPPRAPLRRVREEALHYMMYRVAYHTVQSAYGIVPVTRRTKRQRRTPRCRTASQAAARAAPRSRRSAAARRRVRSAASTRAAPRLVCITPT